MKTHRFSKSIRVLALCAIAGTLPSIQAATIVSSVSDLSFTATGSASVISNTGGTLNVGTSKNTSVYASLPSAYSLAVGQSISTTFSITLDNTAVNTLSSMDISFSDSGTSASGGTMWDSTYNFGYQVNPFDAVLGNNITGVEGNDSNLGKATADATFGTSTHTFTFTLLRSGADEMTLTLQSPTILNGGYSVTNDVIPLQTTTFDTFGLMFRGDAWNEVFPTNKIVATVDSFSISTTGTAVPEPSTYLLIGLGLVGLFMLRRYRNQS